MTSQAFWYAGREWDANDGLEYNRARYYDPASGRFLSKDPSGMVDGTDRYAYAGNNPIGRTDPSGRAVILDPGGGGGCGLACEGYTPPPSYTETVNCGLERVMFLVGFSLGFLGLGFERAEMLRVAGAIIGLGMATGVGSMLRNGIMNSLPDFISFIWTLITRFILPSIGFWQGLGFLAQMAAKLSPVVEAVELPLTILLNVIAWGQLYAEGCGF